MLFKVAVLDEIRRGRVTLAFRRWTKPTVRASGTLRTPIGVLGIDDVRKVAEAEISEADARRAGYGDRDALLSELRARHDGTIYRIDFHLAGEDPRKALRAQKLLSSDDLAALKARLATLDRHSSDGPWTIACLCLINQAQGRPAAELAERLAPDKLVLKRRIRRLKELGLTESLQVGYRLSERGQALLDGLRGRQR